MLKSLRAIVRPRQHPASERGQVLIIFIGVFTVFLLMGAFAIDQGLLQDKRRVSRRTRTSRRGPAQRYG